MYLPSHFVETRYDVIRELIRDHPLATLVTLGPQGLDANHIPLELDPDPAPHGTLRGHVARANPVWRDFRAEVDALAIFQGPSAYVSPSWYPSKASTGKVVPTYNYLVVHAYAPLRIIHDEAWLRALVERLTNRFEAENPKRWHVSDAPPQFIDTMLRAIVGIELPVAKIQAKWKASQNRPEADRMGVAQSLRQLDDADAQAMAGWVER